MPGRRTPFNHALSAPSISPAARTAGATGASVDRLRRGTTEERLQFFDTALLVVVAGSVTDGTHDVTLQHSHDDAAWEDVPADDLQGAAPSLDSTSSDTTVDQGYVGHRRYLRAVSTVTGATSGGEYGALILLDSVESPPVDR